MIDIDRYSIEQTARAVTQDIILQLEETGYEIAEVNNTKPWGAYIRLVNRNADTFIEEYFPGLTGSEARLGNDDLELSPKILVVAPGERLSWQYHQRRAERWRFITAGAYRKSATDAESDRIEAQVGEVVQFAEGERHRLEGVADRYVFVAEIWQHTRVGEPSNEADIIRLADDYTR